LATLAKERSLLEVCQADSGRIWHSWGSRRVRSACE